MSEPKTKLTTQSVKEFLNSIAPDQKQKDSFTLLEMFEKATGEKAGMWGTNIVGFGRYESHTGVWPLVAFSPRKQNLTLYISASNKEYQPFLKNLGKYKVSGGCLHINKLSDVDPGALATLINTAFQSMKKTHV